MKLINLTPHAINVCDADGVELITVEPEAVPARCAVIQADAGALALIPLYRVKFGAVENLPEAQDGTLYIVSMLVRQACPDREDLASPGELIRDEKGQPTGCRGLVLN